MGVNQITEQFRTKYNDEFHYDYDREPSILKQTVRSDGAQNGSTVYWDRVDPSDVAQERTRDGLIPVSQLGLGQGSATMKQHFRKFQIDSFDLFRANPGTRTAHAKSGRSSCNKAIDQEIINVLDSATNQQNSGNAVDFGSKGSIIAWVAALRNRDVNRDGKIWGVVTPNAWAQMETIDEFVSSDYVDVKPFVEGAPPIGQYRTWLGVKWLEHTGLTGKGGAAAKCYVYHSDAIGHQIDGGDPMTHMYYEEEEDRYGTWVKVVHCAGLVLDRGIERAVHNDTAAIG